MPTKETNTKIFSDMCISLNDLNDSLFRATATFAEFGKAVTQEEVTKLTLIDKLKGYIFEIKWLYSNRKWSSCRQKRRSLERAVKKYKNKIRSEKNCRKKSRN